MAFTLFNLFALFFHLSLILSSVHAAPPAGNPSQPSSSSSLASSSTSSTPISTNSPPPSSSTKSTFIQHKQTDSTTTTPSTTSPTATSQAPTSVSSASSSSIPLSSTSSSTRTSLSGFNTVAVDSSRTGIVVPANPTGGANQADAPSTDDSAPTNSPTASPVGFLHNKGAVAATFTIVGLVGVAIAIFLLSAYLRRRRVAIGEDDQFDPENENENWNGKRFMGKRDTYARSSFGMAAMAEKPSYHNDTPASDTFRHDDGGTDISHHEIVPGPFDPYQNNYALPSLGLDQSEMSMEYGQHNPYSRQNQDYGATSTATRGPLAFTGGYYANGGSAPAPVAANEQSSYSNYSTDSPIAAHYAQNPYVIDSYYGANDPVPSTNQKTNAAREPSTRSGPTEWGVAC